MSMEFNEYQEQARKFDVSDKSLECYTLGLIGGTGEVAAKVKKVLEGENVTREDLLEDMGDILCYLSALSTYLAVPLSELANLSLDKLSR